MSEITEIKTLNGYPLADTKARADIATLSEEITKDNYSSGEGYLVNVLNAEVAPLKALRITGVVPAADTGNTSAPVPLAASNAGITATCSNGDVSKLESDGLLYAIESPYQVDANFVANGKYLRADIRDWSEKKDIRYVFHYVFSGFENIYCYFDTPGVFNVHTNNLGWPGAFNVSGKKLIRSSHYEAATYTEIRNSMPDKNNNVSDYNGRIMAYGTATNSNNIVAIVDTRFQTVEEFKAYLQAQATVGTPVEIAYVVLNPYEEDIPDSELEKYRTFAPGGDYMLTNKDDCHIFAEWWTGVVSRNYVDWRVALFGGIGGNAVITGTVTPEQYGAVGDGVTDDTSALQAAIDNGTYIYLGGSYKFTSLTISNGSKTIVCTGKLVSTSAECAIKIASSHNTLTFDELSSVNGILLTGDGNYSIHNRITGRLLNYSGEYGVKLHGVTRSVTNNNIDIGMLSAPSYTGYGIWVCSEGAITNENTFGKTELHGCAVGIYLYTTDTDVGYASNDTCNNNLFTNINPEGCEKGIVIENCCAKNRFDFVRNNEYRYMGSDGNMVIKVLLELRGAPRFNTITPASGHWVSSYLNLVGYTGYNELRGTRYKVPNYINAKLLSHSGGIMWKYGIITIEEDVNNPDAQLLYPALCSLPDQMQSITKDVEIKIAETTANSYAATKIFRMYPGSTQSKTVKLSNSYGWEKLDEVNVLVEPGTAPLIVKDCTGVTIFNLSDDEIPTVPTLYTLRWWHSGILISKQEVLRTGEATV